MRTPIAYLRDIDGTGSLHACAKGDPGAIPVYAHTDSTDDLIAVINALLRRDEINTCTHEATHRGGFIWEICNACGAKWADDEGGKPEWMDPPEWTAARTALARHGVGF